VLERLRGFGAAGAGGGAIIVPGGVCAKVALARQRNRGLFIFFIFYVIYSLLRYKKSHGALAMAKTKPKTQNKLTNETSGTHLFNWGPYRSQAHIRARN